MFLCKRETKYEVNPRGQISYGLALFDLPNLHSLKFAVTAANINILRRTAPFAYIVIFDDPANPWFEQGSAKLDPYIASLEAIRLKRVGLNLAYPNVTEANTWVLVGVHCGDIFPFLGLLEQDRACLLCFPRRPELQEFADITEQAADNQQPLVTLLESGGFLLTTVDSWVFQMMTLDASCLKAFGYEEGAPLSQKLLYS